MNDKHIESQTLVHHVIICYNHIPSHPVTIWIPSLQISQGPVSGASGPGDRRKAPRCCHGDQSFFFLRSWRTELTIHDVIYIYYIYYIYNMYMLFLYILLLVSCSMQMYAIYRYSIWYRLYIDFIYTYVHSLYNWSESVYWLAAIDWLESKARWKPDRNEVWGNQIAGPQESSCLRTKISWLEVVCRGFKKQ